MSIETPSWVEGKGQSLDELGLGSTFDNYVT